MSCDGCTCTTSDTNPFRKMCGRVENGYIYPCASTCCKIDCTGDVIVPMSMLTARTNKSIQNEPLLIGNELMTATVDDKFPSVLPGSPFTTIRPFFQDSSTPKQLITLMSILLFLVILSSVLLFF